LLSDDADQDPPERPTSKIAALYAALAIQQSSRKDVNTYP
jgi:hypothetical protein